MKKLTIISLAGLTLSLAVASGAQAVDRLPIVKVSPPGATVGNHATPTGKHPPCSTCDRRPPVGRYPPGYTVPGATSDQQPVGHYPPGYTVPGATSDQLPVGHYPPGYTPPPNQKKDDLPLTGAPPAE